MGRLPTPAAAERIEQRRPPCAHAAAARPTCRSVDDPPWPVRSVSCRIAAGPRSPEGEFLWYGLAPGAPYAGLHDVVVQPDGSLMIPTDADNGALIHVTRQ